MLTPEEHKRAHLQGKAFALAVLAGDVKAGMTPEMAESVAAGMVEGVREFVATFVSERAAYYLLQRAADVAGAKVARTEAST